MLRLRAILCRRAPEVLKTVSAGTGPLLFHLSLKPPPRHSLIAGNRRTFSTDPDRLNEARELIRRANALAEKVFIRL